MNSFSGELDHRLDALREQELFRELRRVDSAQGSHIEIDGKTLLNFSSNDYLGLANHPVLKEASIRAIEKYGAGAGASRLICGSLAPFHELEMALAAYKKTDAALTFSSGFAAALGAITALAGKDDIIILDKLVHACIVDATRLSGAKLRVFAHNDLNDLEDKLKWAKKVCAEKSEVRILIVTESIFSMDGDVAPLREIVVLKNKYDAWLMVDEAHATGIVGQGGRGLADEFGVSKHIEIQMGTLGKALGAAGGYICGSRSLIDFLVNRARSLIFSTAPVTASAAAAQAGIELASSSEGETRRKTLWQSIEQLHRALQPGQPKYSSAIIPLILGDEAKTMAAATRLREQNIFVPGIRYPSVARGSARLRITLTAGHTVNDLSALIRALEPFVNRIS